MLDNLQTMRRRVRHVLRTYSDGELWRLLPELEEFGQIGLFGGLLRDMALDVPSTFTSDVDLVVDTDQDAALGGFMEGLGAKRNRHGGYRLELRRGQLDIWPLARTWAFEHGLVRERSFQSLPRTTFFTWDSVAYVPTTRALYVTDGFLRSVRTMVVDVELIENPYPLGTAVRALRILLSGRAALSPGLALHLDRLLDSFGDERVMQAEADGFTRRYLSESALKTVRGRLRDHVMHTSIAPFRIEHQLFLPFGTSIPLGDALAPWKQNHNVSPPPSPRAGLARARDLPGQEVRDAGDESAAGG